MAAVELQGIVRRYPGASAEAVAGVDVAIAPGERFAIVGPSGSGKTTLLRMIAGLESIDSGEVRVGGRRINEVAPRNRGVGMVFQHPALYPHLDVLANLTYGLRARGVPRDERTARAVEVAGWLGVGGLLHRKPRALSGGERQRVALGRAVLTRPSVLLLDEPFSSLDAPLRASTRAAVLELHRRLGGTLILVTHDQTEALAFGDRVAVMKAGRFEQVGTPRQLYQEPTTRFVAGFLGDPPMAMLPGRLVEGQRGTPEGLDLATTWLGLRPEAVAAEPAAEALMRLVATLDRLEPRGHEAIAWFVVDGHPLAARVPADFARSPGEPVRLGLDLRQARWFASDDGARLA